MTKHWRRLTAKNDSLANDSDNEKKIWKAVKESRQLREEKKRVASSKVPKAKGVIPHSLERRVILEHSNASYATPLVARKQSQPRDGRSVVASSQDTLPGTAELPMSRMEQELLGSPQAAINKQASEFLVSGTANDLCCDSSMI